MKNRVLTLILASALAAGASAPSAAQELPWEKVATRIVTSLNVANGETVILRYDPKNYAALEPVVRRQLEAKGAKVESLPYAPVADLAERLARTDIYVWLPAGDDANTVPAERALLAKWLDDARGRQIHFHWNGGTRDVDGLPVAHVAAAYDPIYLDALDIDYKALGERQRRAAALLRSGETRVTTPAGTDIRFRIGPDRPFNLQDGDGSAERMKEAKVRVDREIELPAGVLRVAPIESSVQGTLVIPKARFGTAIVKNARLEFKDGLVVKATAEEGQAALDTFLTSAPAAKSFREFGLGFNPKLVVPAGQTALPYYGYGDAVVRLSLGDNLEVGGAVRGGGVRWLFFTDTTVTVGTTPLVKNGKLVAQQSQR
ncbi:MAG TPA: aminopeptidase [Luteitalea sp.]|nr:aminopeptidase [Luteitalea sp.]